MPEANSTEGNSQSSATTQSDAAGPASGTTTQSNQSNTQSHGTAGQESSSGTGHDGSGHAGQGAGNTNPVPNIGELVTAIQGMPEQVVRAIREASQPAQQPRKRSADTDTGQGSGSAQTTTQSGSQGSGQSTERTPGKKSFSDWWFGR